MDVITELGTVKTRDFYTSLQESHSLFLKDNPDLKTFFMWMKANKIDGENSFPPRIQEMLAQIRFNSEVKWHISHEDQYLTFHHIVPMKGDYQNAIKGYMNLFHRVIFKPLDVWWVDLK